MTYGTLKWVVGCPDKPVGASFFRNILCLISDAISTDSLLAKLHFSRETYEIVQEYKPPDLLIASANLVKPFLRITEELVNSGILRL